MEQHHQQLGQDQQAMIDTYQKQIRELYESQDKEQAIQEEIWKVQMKELKDKLNQDLENVKNLSQ